MKKLVALFCAALFFILPMTAYASGASTPTRVPDIGEAVTAYTKDDYILDFSSAMFSVMDANGAEQNGGVYGLNNVMKIWVHTADNQTFTAYCLDMAESYPLTIAASQESNISQFPQNFTTVAWPAGANYDKMLWVVEHTYPAIPMDTMMADAGASFQRLVSEIQTNQSLSAAEAEKPLHIVKITDTLVTDAQGKARVEFISQGKYKLTEQQQSGYVVLEGLEFEITSAHAKEHPLQYTVSNVPTRLLIEKQCGATKTLLAGATFKLTDQDGKVVKLVLQQDGTYQPAKANETGVESFPVNDKGQVVICYLPAGSYTVTELTGPVGYALSAPVSTEVGTERVIATSLGAKQSEDMNNNEESNKTDGGDSTAKTEEKASATPTNLLVDSDGNYLAETSLSVVDLPLALKISKVHAKTQKPLMGAAFQLKAADKLTTPLTFTVKDGVYWYDAKGSLSTIQMDKNAEALIYGLPTGKYQLEETVVPTNFFPAVPQSIEITMTNTSEAPKEVVVVNTPTVKLGIDSDKFNVVIAIALTVLIGGGLAAYAIIRRRMHK